METCIFSLEVERHVSVPLPALCHGCGTATMKTRHEGSMEMRRRKRVAVDNSVAGDSDKDSCSTSKLACFWVVA